MFISFKASLTSKQFQAWNNKTLLHIISHIQCFYLKLSLWGSSNDNRPHSNVWVFSWGNLTHTYTDRLWIQIQNKHSQKLVLFSFLSSSSSSVVSLEHVSPESYGEACKFLQINESPTITLWEFTDQLHHFSRRGSRGFLKCSTR